MTSETIELVECVRQRLDHQDNPVRIAGPVSESAIVAAEDALGCPFPPSYRQFLRTWGGIALPTHLGIVHDFIGVSSGDSDHDVVARTLRAREERKLAEHLVVVGAGYIGLELGIAYRKLGARVTIVEAAGRVLPAYDDELVKPVAASLKRLGIALHLESSVLGLVDDGRGIRMKTGGGEEDVLEADRVLVAVGRRPRTEGYGLESLLLDMNGRHVRIDNQCRTSMRNVWAIGDLTGEPMLAHRAMAQGEMVAEIIAGKRRHFTPNAIPAVCFTDPEVVVVGMTPQEAARLNVDCIGASFPFAANGRAMTLESTDGFVRVVARKDNHVIVGWQAVGGAVSELSTAFVQSIEMGAQLEDVAGTIHAHPTLGEAVQEAALRALGRALHI